MDEIKISFHFDDSPVEMNFPKTITVEDALIQFLKKTNSLITLSTDKIVFFYKNRILNCSDNLKKSLFQVFAINRDITVRVVDTGLICGGGPVDFCDVSKKKHEGHKLTSDGPTYRITGKGINIYGLCKGNPCKAYDKEVIVPINKKTFDLINEKYDLKCPLCSNIIIPKTVGFRNCEYKISGKKYQNDNVEKFSFIDRADNSGEIKYYNPNDNGKALMIELKFEILKYL